jgi:hypothetical protein
VAAPGLKGASAAVLRKLKQKNRPAHCAMPGEITGGTEVMVVAIFCGHPDNLEDSDESERGTVAQLDSNPEPRAAATELFSICHLPFLLGHFS